MGYFLIEAPEPKWYGRSALEDFYPPLTESIEAKLFQLRDEWVEIFLCILNAADGYIPRQWAIEWLDRSGEFPKTREKLEIEIKNTFLINRAALRCLDEWHNI